MAKSHLEIKMLLILTALAQKNNKKLEQEYKFHPNRRWRFDFAIPESKIAIEVEGGTWLPKGGHTSGKGFVKDCEKYNAAVILGWKVLRYTGKTINDVVADLGMIAW